MGVQLTDAEAWEFLRNGHTAILSTLRRDGSPVAVPLWYVVVDGTLYLRSLARSAKVQHVRRDPRVSLLVETGEAWAELRAVLISGTAALVSDPEVCERVDDEFEGKYANFRAPENVPDATKRHYAAEVAYLRIDPDRPFLTWDNRKIRTRPARQPAAPTAET